MSRRDPYWFTRKESVDRLQSVKGLLGNKERLAYRASALTVLPDHYDPLDDKSYYSAPLFPETGCQLLASRLLSLTPDRWLDVKCVNSGLRFRRLPAVDFVCWDLGGRTPIGAIIDLAFYSWKEDSDLPRASKFASVWLGTWHHCPLVAWRSSNGEHAKFDYLPEFFDLLHEKHSA